MNQWTLSAGAFEKLLAAFDPDRERAAERYEDARSRLVFFFESRGAFDGDGLADDTLNRVARKLDDLTFLLARLTEDAPPIEAPAQLPHLLASDLDVPARGSAHAPSRRGGTKITRR